MRASIKHRNVHGIKILTYPNAIAAAAPLRKKLSNNFANGLDKVQESTILIVITE